MSKTPRINGRMARSFVQDRKAFRNSNSQLYAVNHTPLLYAVYSYGDHWPLFVHDGFDWYENEDKYSRTTTRHRSNTHPRTSTQPRSCTWLRNFIADHCDFHDRRAAFWMAAAQAAADGDLTPITYDDDFLNA